MLIMDLYKILSSVSLAIIGGILTLAVVVSLRAKDKLSVGH